MLEYILDIIRNNQVFIDLLQPTARQPKLYYMSTIDPGNCIIYGYELAASDAVVIEDKLTIRVISNDVDLTQKLLKALDDELLSFGDYNKHTLILNCHVNGGGTIEDGEFVHTIRYYYIKSQY